MNGGSPTLPEGPPGWPVADEEVRLAVQNCIQDGSWGKYHGGHVDFLSQQLARLHQVPFALACCSGTFAVELALRSIKLNAGDEVILAGYDFPGNFRAIESVGARPVLVDIDPATWCLDHRNLGQALSPSTRAILVSHLHGGLARMDSIRQFADEHHLSVVEDACQSPGAIVQGRPAGSWGDVGVLSFGGSKLLSAGRGGALVAQREEFFQRAKIFCERGNNAFPISELQAAVLAPQLAKLEARNQRRRENVTRLLAACRSITELSAVEIPTGDSVPSYYKVAWRVEGNQSFSRAGFVTAIQAEGVAIDTGFRGFTRRGVRRCRRVGELPHSQEAAEATVLLHHPILLEPSPVIDRVAEAIQKVVAGLLGDRDQ